MGKYTHLNDLTSHKSEKTEGSYERIESVRELGLLGDVSLDYAR